MAMIWKTNLEAEQTEYINVLDGPKNQLISKVKSSGKLKNASSRLDQQENMSKTKTQNLKETTKEILKGDVSD